MQLPVVGIWNTQLSITTNGFLKIQNFIFPRPRQLLVGAVSGSFSIHTVQLRYEACHPLKFYQSNLVVLHCDY